MKIDIVTLFPEICRAPLSESIMKRAQENKIVDLYIHNLRDWTSDKHHIVDDAPFGGGQGMVMKPEPIFEAVAELRDREEKTSNPPSQGYGAAGAALELTSTACRAVLPRLRICVNIRKLAFVPEGRNEGSQA
jgi:tRNA (guanine-N1)-methyltransferase